MRPFILRRSFLIKDLIEWRKVVASCLLEKGIDNIVLMDFPKDIIKKVGEVIDNSLPLDLESLSDEVIKKKAMFVATDIELKLRM